MLEILPVTGIGEIVPGADLAHEIATAAPWLRDGDVLVVTSKIVSKAEGRMVPVPPADGPQRDACRAEAIAAETARVVAARGQTRIVATHHGFVMAAAGVDDSNVDRGHVLLLPKDPDGSARTLRAALAARGVHVGVVISDTAGRPWRNGLTDMAIGAAGVAPLRDHRGQTDPYGNELHLTQAAIVDELAAAAELVKGKIDGIPVAVVRGLPTGVLDHDGPGVVATLVRDAEGDLFSLGTAEAHAGGLRAAATLPDQPPTPSMPPTETGPRTEAGSPTDAAQRALDTVANATADTTRLTVEPGPPVAVRATTTGPRDPATLMRLGADTHRLHAALAAEGIHCRVRYDAHGAVLLTID